MNKSAYKGIQTLQLTVPPTAKVIWRPNQESPAQFENRIKPGVLGKAHYAYYYVRKSSILSAGKLVL